MNAVRPAYFYEMGFAVNSVKHLRDDIPANLRQSIVSYACQSLGMFITEENAREMLPRAFAKAEVLLSELRLWAAGSYPGRQLSNWDQVRQAVDSFSTTLTDELDRTFNYVLTDKGALSAHVLVDGVSKSYPSDTLVVLGELLRKEIDNAGNCLAFTMYTACGFHILRAVELTIMAYVVASKGQLPKPQNRSWSTYITVLREAGAHQDVIDMLMVLKAKRNPVMHPEERLDLHEAASLLCISEATISSLVKDAQRRSLKDEFEKAIVALPELVRGGRAGVP